MRYFLLLIISGFFIFSSSSVFAWETPTTRFSLNQSENSTTLKYNGKSIYQWSHSIESKKLSPDSKCLPSMKRQMLCVKEELFKYISITGTLNPRFFLIYKMNYEWTDVFLFDSQTKKIYTEIRGLYRAEGIINIEAGVAGLYIHTSDPTREGGGLLLLKKGTNNLVRLFSNTTDSENITMSSFELLPNKKVKIIYTRGENNYVSEKIIRAY